MKRISLVLLLLGFFYPAISYGGSVTPTVPILATEQGSFQLFSFFDLRERESYLQYMNTGTSLEIVHVQIFLVNNNCNEFDFFDQYTPLDTHIYNIRNIVNNDGNPSGVVIPDDSYGFVVLTVMSGISGNSIANNVFIGSFRIVDVNGFEYRTNAAGMPESIGGSSTTFSFNYSTLNGATFADIVIFTADDIGVGESAVTAFPNFGTFMKFRPTIYDENEVVFSCSDIVFACIESDDPGYAGLLSTAGVSMGGAEFGINEMLPHSKDKGKICAGNNLDQGFVRLETQNVTGEAQADLVLGFAGINNGNDRSSMEIFTATP